MRERFFRRNYYYLRLTSITDRGDGIRTYDLVSAPKAYAPKAIVETYS